jgi:hypothetical protein
MPKNISKQSWNGWKLSQDARISSWSLPIHTFPDIFFENKTKDGNKVEREKKNCSHEGNTVERDYSSFLFS